MGAIVGAAAVSHHPGLMLSEAMRKARGAGRDSDLIAGFARLRAEPLSADENAGGTGNIDLWFEVGEATEAVA